MRRLLMIGLVLLVVSATFAQGVPFLRNYMDKDYHAHKRNFDVVTDKDGIVYFANFEGLLYYDNVERHIIHTPGITRATVTYCDKNNVVWVGGYNYFGYVATKNNGELCLKQFGSSVRRVPWHCGQTMRSSTSSTTPSQVAIWVMFPSPMR